MFLGKTSNIKRGIYIIKVPARQDLETSRGTSDSLLYTFKNPNIETPSNVNGSKCVTDAVLFQRDGDMI